MFGVDLLEGLMGTVAITVAAAAVMIALALIVPGQEGAVLGFGRPSAG
jgi:regulator of protease activity HflC (stomatin/prohibitin superfamily)